MVHKNYQPPNMSDEDYSKLIKKEEIEKARKIIENTAKIEPKLLTEIVSDEILKILIDQRINPKSELLKYEICDLMELIKEKKNTIKWS